MDRLKNPEGSCLFFSSRNMCIILPARMGAGTAENVCGTEGGPCG